MQRMHDDRNTLYYYPPLSGRIYQPSMFTRHRLVKRGKKITDKEKASRSYGEKRAGPMYHKSPTKWRSYTTRESECGFFRSFISPVLSPSPLPSTPPPICSWFPLLPRICYVSAAKDNRLPNNSFSSETPRVRTTLRNIALRRVR